MTFGLACHKGLKHFLAYTVLITSIIGSVYVIYKGCFAFVYLWERITSLPFIYFFMTAFLLLCAFICLGVAVFSNISPHNQISRRVLWSCVIVSAFLQCAGMLLVQAWKWHLPALAGALFIIQYLSCFWAGLVQKDILNGKLEDTFVCVFPQFWVLVPLTAAGWLFVSGYY